jgi:hypothetical protein
MTTPTIARAADKWQRFFSALCEQDRQVLDRAAAGQKLKVVCHELDVNYDAVQKRFKRWQQELDFHSLNNLLHVWRTVRSKQRLVDLAEPTLLRYASEIANEAARRLNNAAYDMTISDAQRQRQPAAEMFARSTHPRHGDGPLLTQCVLSPALWHTLLCVGQEQGEAALQRAHIVAQHRLFLHALMPNEPVDADDQSVTHLLRWMRDIDRASSMMSTGRGTPVALPLLVAIRRMHVLRHHALSGAEIALRDSTRAQESAIWQRVADAMGAVAFSAHDDMAFLHQMWRDVKIKPAARDAQSGGSDIDGGAPEPEFAAVATCHVLGPLTGLALALMATQIQHPDLAACSAEALQTLVHVRLQHAQALGIHPVRLLAHFSMREAGVAVESKFFALQSGELLIHDEASVRSLALAGGLARKALGGSLGQAWGDAFDMSDNLL